MPTELPYVNEPTSKPAEPQQPVRKSEKEVFDLPEKNVKIETQSIVIDDGTELTFPKTQKPPDAIELPKKKGKPRGHAKDPEKMKEHMAKMRAKSAETRARKKAEKQAQKKQPLQPVPENKPLEIQGGLPEGFAGHVPKNPPNTPVEKPKYSQPVDATALQQRLAELEKQNKAYKDWYSQNKHHLNNIPVKPKPSQPIPIPQPQGQYNMNQGLDRLSHLEAMIRKDEREKLLAKQKAEREEQAKNLANARNKMPVGLRKWQNLPAQQHYSNNVDMWSKCFEPK